MNQNRKKKNYYVLFARDDGLDVFWQVPHPTFTSFLTNKNISANMYIKVKRDESDRVNTLWCAASPVKIDT